MPDLDIIEISSSPERPQATSSRARVRARTREQVQKNVSSRFPIIEVSDSDDDQSVDRQTQASSAGYKAPFSLHEAKQQPSEPQRDDTISASQSSSAAVDQSMFSATLASSSHDPPAPQSEQERVGLYTSQVLEIVPDVVPEHARQLVLQYLNAQKDNVVELVLHVLLEDPLYPKIDKKGKAKRKREPDDPLEGASTRVNVDYGNRDRKGQGGEDYTRLALVRFTYSFASGLFL